MPKIECFRVGLRVGVRITRPDYERGYDTGTAISFGLLPPELRIEWGAYTRQVWTDRHTGQRYDFGYGFECGEWLTPYGVSGSRWDRLIRLMVTRRRNAAARRRTHIEAAAVDIEQIPF